MVLIYNRVEKERERENTFKCLKQNLKPNNKGNNTINNSNNPLDTGSFRRTTENCSKKQEDFYNLLEDSCWICAEQPEPVQDVEQL